MKTVGYSEHPLGFVDIDNDAYHAGPGVSKSHLDLIAKKSPLHYWDRYINPDREPEEKTVPMIFGQATHFAILQPNLFETRVVRGLGHARRSNADKQVWKEFEEENVGNYIVSDDTYDNIRYIRDAVWDDPACAGLLSAIIPEQSVYAMRTITDEEGVELVDQHGDPLQGLTKAQLDGLSGWDYILDLKSTEDASETAFMKSMANYRYDVQQAWYQSVMDNAFGRHPDHFFFLCFEKVRPFATGIYGISKTDILMANQACQRDFSKIERCRRDNHWPTYSSKPKTLSLPGWYRR